MCSSDLDLVTLLEAAIGDATDLYNAEALDIDSVFALSSALGGADAEVIANGVLIDFKASIAGSVIGTSDVYQLVGYALADLDNWYGIRSVGIHALRWRTRWTISLGDLLRRLSGVDRPVLEWRERFSATLRTDDAQDLRVRRRHHAGYGPGKGESKMRKFGSSRRLLSYLVVAVIAAVAAVAAGGGYALAASGGGACFNNNNTDAVTNNGPVNSPGPGGLFSNNTTGTVPVAWFGAYRNGSGSTETLHVFVICSAP